MLELITETIWNIKLQYCFLIGSKEVKKLVFLSVGVVLPPYGRASRTVYTGGHVQQPSDVC